METNMEISADRETKSAINETIYLDWYRVTYMLQNLPTSFELLFINKFD